jgi:osmotically-inducible protein OsmY
MTLQCRRTLLGAFLAFGVVALASGCTKPAPAVSEAHTAATISITADDEAVTSRVRAALLRDATAGSLGLAVVTTQGDVRLSGLVARKDLAEHAVLLAGAVEGVHSVHDEIAIR